jgi:hypothetical protein
MATQAQGPSKIDFAPSKTILSDKIECYIPYLGIFFTRTAQGFCTEALDKISSDKDPKTFERKVELILAHEHYEIISLTRNMLSIVLLVAGIASGLSIFTKNTNFWSVVGLITIHAYRISKNIGVIQEDRLNAVNATKIEQPV